MTSSAERILSAIIDNEFVYARTEGEMAEVVRVVVDGVHSDWASLLYLWDRPCRSVSHHDTETNEYPDHQLRVSTSPSASWGALNFFGDGAVWDSRNPSSVADTPELWFDPSGDTRFHPSAAIPIAVVRAAVTEFTATGRRPTCVAWQSARLV